MNSHRIYKKIPSNRYVPTPDLDYLSITQTTTLWNHYQYIILVWIDYILYI